MRWFLRPVIVLLAVALSTMGLGQEAAPSSTPAPAPGADKSFKKKTLSKKKTAETVDDDSDADGGDEHLGRGDVSLNVKIGFVSYTGDLTEEKNAGSLGFNAISFPDPKGAMKAKRGILNDYGAGFEMRFMLDYELSQVEQKGDFAAVPPTEVAKVGLMQIAALPCFLTNYSFNVCPHLGIGHVTIYSDDDDYEARYGAFPYGLMLLYKHDKLISSLDLTAGAQMQFYEVSVTAAGKELSALAGAINFFLGLAF